MASEGWADAVPGETRSRLAPASSWTDFDAERAASPRTAGLGPATRFAGTPPPEAMTMRFYTGPHRFYCGVDLHTRTLSLCVLDHTRAASVAPRYGHLTCEIGQERLERRRNRINPRVVKHHRLR
jgi:hypothetical protein